MDNLNISDYDVFLYRMETWRRNYGEYNQTVDFSHGIAFSCGSRNLQVAKIHSCSLVEGAATLCFQISQMAGR